MDSRFAGLIFFLRGRRPNIPQSIITISLKLFWPLLTIQKETLYIMTCLHYGELQCSSYNSKCNNTGHDSTVLIFGWFFALFRSSVISHGHLLSFMLSCSFCTLDLRDNYIVDPIDGILRSVNVFYPTRGLKLGIESIIVSTRCTFIPSKPDSSIS